MDRIHIRDLSLRCIIGVFPEEREKQQDILVNVTLECDVRAAGRSDRLEDSVDYKEIKQAIVALVDASGFNLIEKMAEEIAAVCLTNEKVHRVHVAIDKPGALRFARSVAVEITRPAES